MPNLNGGFFVAMALLTPMNTAHAIEPVSRVSADNFCLYKNDGSGACVWCEGKLGNTPNATCDPTYAGCITGGTTNLSGNHYYTIETSKQTDTWDCGYSGWTHMRSVQKCDRYSYRQSNGECVMCPYPDFKQYNVFDELVDIFPRGDNYEYKLTGCHIYITPDTLYADETGTFVFTEGVQCDHSGIL